jgi:hypothetical protein
MSRALTLNPYAAAESAAATIAPVDSQHRLSHMVRPAIYLHLIAVALTGLGMTQDTGSVEWPEQLIPLIKLGLIYGVLGFFACPFALLIGLIRSTVSIHTRMLLLTVEALIIVAHFTALIPSVQ